METFRLYVIATLVLLLMCAVAMAGLAAIAEIAGNHDGTSATEAIVAFLLMPFAARLIMRLQDEEVGP